MTGTRTRAVGQCLAAVVMVAGWTALARAQQRPLVTEDPVTVGGGQILVELGVDWAADVAFPVSGLRGDLLTVPVIGISVGVGPIAEIQLDGSPYRSLSITEQLDAPLSGLLPPDLTGTHAVDDMVIATKLRLVNEAAARPAMGLRFATKLPNASNESGLGHDTTDFYASFLLGKTMKAVRVVANAGLAIVGDPTTAARQDDLLTLGLSTVLDVTTTIALVAEYNGRMNLADRSPIPGAENRGVARAGVRVTRGSLRLDTAALFGATTSDLDIGATAGLTWIFRAFSLP